MKKIMFNDRYGLTQAVLSGRKTQTRRIVPKTIFQSQYDIDDDKIWIEDMYGDWLDVRKSKYCFKVGEVVAVAQSYESLFHSKHSPDDFLLDHSNMNPKYCGAGFKNKMFVKSELMPHRIRITDVRVERLQDISDEDCIAEGIREVEVDNNWGKYATHTEYRVVYQDNYGREKPLIGMTPREAYAALIDRISGKGAWESNPYVFAYTFELVK